MADVNEVLRAELAGLKIADEHFPMWRQWGIEDESVAVHSLGLTYLTTIGQRAGYACCSEYPVAGHKVRADSVWWDSRTRDAVALFEIRAVQRGDELRDKVRNLLRAYHRLGGKADVLGLVFWTKNFYPLGDDVLQELWRVLEQGFESEARVRIPPAPPRLLQVFECLHHSANGQHTLKGFVQRSRP